VSVLHKGVETVSTKGGPLSRHVDDDRFAVGYRQLHADAEEVRSHGVRCIWCGARIVAVGGCAGSHAADREQDQC
jgi:hypothetical protein